MEDLSKLILDVCLAMNLVITMVAYGLTIITLEVIPDNWYFKKCSQSQFKIFIFCLYFLIIWGITLI